MSNGSFLLFYKQHNYQVFLQKLNVDLNGLSTKENPLKTKAFETNEYNKGKGGKECLAAPGKPGLAPIAATAGSRTYGGTLGLGLPVFMARAPFGLAAGAAPVLSVPAFVGPRGARRDGGGLGRADRRWNLGGGRNGRRRGGRGRRRGRGGDWAAMGRPGTSGGLALRRREGAVG